MQSVSLTSSPFPPSRASGTRARGLAYERKVGKFLSRLCAKEEWKLWDHPWFEYNDGIRVGYFQPDFIVERPSGNLLIEVKLTYVDTRVQVQKYLKYLKVIGLVCAPVIVVKNLTPTTPSFVNDFNEIYPNSVLHLWI